MDGEKSAPLISLLFVNKTLSSRNLTRSQAGERTQIFSHVQQKRRKRERRKVDADPKATQISIIDLQGDKEAREVDQIRDDDSRLERHSPTSLCSTFPTDNGWDPFYCTIAGSDASFQPMLHFAFSHFARPIFLAEAFAPKSVARSRISMRHNQIMDERLQCCVHDELLMYSTLAYGSSSMAWAFGSLKAAKPPEYFIGRTLELVRARLSDPYPKVDNWLLISVYALAVTQMWASIPAMWRKSPLRRENARVNMKQYRQASKVHFRALLDLVSYAGGWEFFDAYVFESIIMCDKFGAMVDATSPMIPPFWAPGTTPPRRQGSQLPHVKSLSDLGEAFRDLNLHHGLRRVIEDTVQYIRTAGDLWQCQDPTAEEESWLFLQLQTLNCQLLHLDQLSDADNYVRLAVLVFLQNLVNFGAVRLSADLMLRHFHAVASKPDLLIPSEVSNTSPCNVKGSLQISKRDQLQLWCLCTGAMVTEPSLEKQWCCMAATALMRSLYIDATSSSLLEIMQSFLYVPDRQQTQMKNVIERLQSGLEQL